MIDYSVWLEAGAIVKAKNFNWYCFVEEKMENNPDLNLNEDAFLTIEMDKGVYFIINNFSNVETGHSFYDLKDKKENFEITPDKILLWKENFEKIFNPYKKLLEDEFKQQIEIKVMLLNDIH